MNESVKGRNEERDRRLVVLYDAAKKCLAILEHTFQRIESLTSEMSQSIDQKKDDPLKAVDLYQLFISYIDFTHRLYDIIDSMPYIPRKNSLMKKMDEKHELVNEARNYYQHMRGDLSEGKPLTFPILGGVSWIHNNVNYVTIPEHAQAQCSVNGIWYDRVENRWVCRFQITVKDKALFIDRLHEFSRELFTWIHDGLTFSVPQKLGWGHTTTMKVALVGGPSPQPPPGF